MNISTSSGKGLVSTSRTYTNAKWEGTRRPREKASPVGKPHPSKNIYDDKLNNNDNFLESGDIFYSNVLLNFRNYVLLIYLFCFSPTEHTRTASRFNNFNVDVSWI